MGRAQPLARIDASALTAQPLPVQQVRAGELRTQLRAAQPIDRFAIQVVSGGADAQQRPGARLDADIIVTATGLNVVPLGEVDFVVDGSPVDFSRTWTYKGFMCSGVPNLAMALGYTEPDPREDLSPGQMEEIDRVYDCYPQLNDDEFVRENLDRWMRV